MENDVFDVLHRAYSLSKKSDEVIGGRFADDFAGETTWSRALALDVPGHPDIQGLRYMDFKDCTNHYVLNGRNEARPLFGLGDADLEALLGFMDGFADGRKAQMRRQAAAARYAGFVKAAGQGVPNGRKPKV